MIEKVDFYDIHLTLGDDKVQIGLLRLDEIKQLVPQLKDIINLVEDEQQAPISEPKPKGAGGRPLKDLSKYIEMHEAGQQKGAIIMEMEQDGIAGSTRYIYWERVLKESKRVTKIDPSKGLTDAEKIEKLMEQNKADAPNRKKLILPRV